MPADPHHCPHMPGPGRVYRLRVSLVQTRVDERVDEYLVCERCYQAAMAAIGAPSPQPSPSDWRLSRDAVAAFARLARERDHERAAQRLRELVPTARLRDTRETLTLWRSGPTHYGLRWLVDGDLVVWVGQGRPPERLWQPEVSRA